MPNDYLISHLAQS